MENMRVPIAYILINSRYLILVYEPKGLKIRPCSKFHTLWYIANEIPHISVYRLTIIYISSFVEYLSIQHTSPFSSCNLGVFLKKLYELILY